MELKHLLGSALIGDIIYDAPMSKYTSFRTGGRADALVMPKSEKELSRAILLARENGVPYCVIGNGSNLLVRDGGVRGIVIRLAEGFSGIQVEGNTVTARAGELLSSATNAALHNGLTGLEFAGGIPGSVGGGMAMNAGAYGGELANVCEGARVMDVKTGSTEYIPVSGLEMGYRTSRALREGNIITEAVFSLAPGDRSAIKALMDDLNRRRREKQPLAFPSAGSTFKRPEGHFAGALIEQANLKGVSVGGAQVSQKHAGFIINAGGASSKDILELMRLVQTRVYDMSGVTLEPEVRIIGED